MTTVINNSGDGKDPTGMIVGLIALIIVITLFFVYVLPVIQGSGVPKNDSINIDVKLPTGGTNDTETKGQ